MRIINILLGNYAILFPSGMKIVPYYAQLNSSSSYISRHIDITYVEDNFVEMRFVLLTDCSV